MKRLLVCLVLILFSQISILLALDKNVPTRKPVFRKPTAVQTYPNVNITWIGIGELTRFGITNAGQQALWVQPNDWDGYDGTFPEGTFDSGDNAEWPAGTNQTYCYSASLWVGGEIPVIAEGDTLFWDRRVDTGNYWGISEWATVESIYTSDQVYPSGHPQADKSVYKQKYRDKEDYQELWPFLDTSINGKRPGDLRLDPANGDFVADEDTYCAYGTFISKDSAVWIYPDRSDYDVKPLGVRVSQRTYSWTSPVAEDAIVINFIIENKNDVPIRNLYAGYFMDNDIGYADINEPQGSNDDLIGFDPALSLGYTYDFDGYEKDWVTVAGYIGAVWLEGIARSPINDSYLTGFQTWTREGDEANTDASGFDILRYRQLNNEQTTDPAWPYEVFETPQDVRMLLCTGPNQRLNPGQKDTVTVAIVMGESLADLQQNTRNIQRMFDSGYVLPEAPPSPNLTAYPDDRKVHLSWDNFPENVPDPFTGEIDFEGYRVYKNETGLAADWELLAEYDIFGTRTANSVTTRITKGNTTAKFYFKEFIQDTLLFRQYKGDQTYTINFTRKDNFIVYNQSSGVLYAYNKKTLTASGIPNTFCVVSKVRDRWVPMPFAGTITTTDPNYNQPNLTYPPDDDPDSTIVYFDGMFIVLGTGPEDPAGLASRDPAVGHVLELKTYKGDILGSETGLKYSFVDESVTNGLSYLYSVTSFDKGSAKLALPPLESSKKQNQIEIIPVTPPSTSSDPAVENLVYEGPFSGKAIIEVIQPAEVTGHQYEITYFDSLNPPYGNAKYWRLRDHDLGTILLDSMTNVFGTTYDPNAVTPPVDGINIDFQVEAVPTVNEEFSEWLTENKDSFGITTKQDMEPYDFKIQFPDYPDNIDKDIDDNDIAYNVYNTHLNEYHQSRFYDVNGDGIFNEGDSVSVFGKYTTSSIFSFHYDTTSQVRSLTAGDIYQLITNKPFQISNEITFRTVGPQVRRTEVDLTEIKVVPNPYYIRAEWDENKYTNHIMFINLPEKCTIRIFTVSGILIKELEHDAIAGDSNSMSGTYQWNMRNKEELKIASGLYIFQVNSDAGEFVGKFAVIR